MVDQAYIFTCAILVIVQNCQGPDLENNFYRNTNTIVEETEETPANRKRLPETSTSYSGFGGQHRLSGTRR